MIELLIEYINKPNLAGKLLVNGDFEVNSLLFRFVFNKENMVHPLIITIKTLPIKSDRITEEHSLYTYRLHHLELSNWLIKSDVIYPSFPLKDNKIEILDVCSHISCCSEKNLTVDKR
jgi:hypothetical protein